MLSPHREVFSYILNLLQRNRASFADALPLASTGLRILETFERLAMTFSAEQLNFFKFSTVVLDDFPVALRQVFVFMWNNLVATSPGIPKWDDSVAVRNLLLLKEGGAKRVTTLNKSYKEWDCTALFKATLFAQTFAVPDGTGGVSTLNKLYVKPRGISSGTFHHSVASPTGDQAETYALALDQLRLLRNSLCHQISTQKIDKATFDNYIQLAKDAFIALGQNTTKIDEIGKLGEDDFPTTRLRQLEDELKKEKDAAIKFKQIDDHLTKIESLVDDLGSDIKDVKTEVKDVKTQVEDVSSDMKNMKTEVADMESQIQDVGSEVKEVKTELANVKTQVEDVGSNVKTELADVKTQVEDVGLDVKTELADVKTQVEDVGSDMKTELADVKTQVEDVGSEVKEVKTELTDVKTQVKEVGSDVKELNARVDDIKEAMQAGSSEGILS